MDAHGVDVLHGADLDHVAGGVPQDLELDLLPAGDGALDEDLAHAAEMDAPVGDLPQALLVVGDAAAGAAQGVGGTDDDGVVDLVGEGHGGVHRLHHVGDDAGLTDGLHGVLEALAVLRLADGLGGGPQQADGVLVQIALLVEAHGQIQAGLSAQSGQDGVRLLFFDDLGHRGDVQRLDIDVVRDVLVGHDGGGVGVHQNDLHALLLQRPAGLGAGIVELGGLTDDDGAGAQHQHLVDIRIFRHAERPPSPCWKRTGRTDIPCPWVRATPPGGTAL